MAHRSKFRKLGKERPESPRLDRSDVAELRGFYRRGYSAQQIAEYIAKDGYQYTAVQLDELLKPRPRKSSETNAESRNETTPAPRPSPTTASAKRASVGKATSSAKVNQTVGPPAPGSFAVKPDANDL